MNESNSSSGQGTCGTKPRGRCGLGRSARLGVAAAALVGLGALATVAVNVTAHEGRGHGHRGPVTIEGARERALDKAAWMLGSVDATPEQEQRVNEIVTRLVDDLYPLREEHRAHRRELIDALARPQVDAGELERIRSEELALADTASRELMLAVTELSRILEPEQRQALVGMVTRFRHGK